MDVEAAATAVGRAFSPARFDPRNATGTVRPAATDDGAAIAATPFAAHLTTAPPGLGLDIVACAFDTFDALARGILDVALQADAALPPDFHALDLFAETYACAVRAGHPMLVQVKDLPIAELLRQCCRYQRAVMLYLDTRRMLGDDVLAAYADTAVSMGRALERPQFATPYVLSAGSALAGSDIILCLPTHAAHPLAGAHAVVFVPLGANPGFTYRLARHARTQRDPRQRWLRGEIGRLASRRPRAPDRNAPGAPGSVTAPRQRGACPNQPTPSAKGRDALSAMTGADPRRFGPRVPRPHQPHLVEGRSRP